MGHAEYKIKEGDILGGTWGYDCTLPFWARVVKRTAKYVTLVEIPEIVLEGRHNGYWTSIPDTRVDAPKKKGEEWRAKVTQSEHWGEYTTFHNGRNILTQWDGEPYYCNDMD